MFRMYDFKGRSLYTKKLLAFFTSEELWQKRPILLSLKRGPRKQVLIVATDQSIQSSTDKPLPCWLFTSISFPEKRAMCGPSWRAHGRMSSLTARHPLLLLHWIGTWWAEVQCGADRCQSFTRDHCTLMWILYGGGVKNQFCQQVLIAGSCYY